MISDEKMNHLVGLVLNKISESKMIEFVDKEGAFREAKRAGMFFLKHLQEASTVARQRILSQKNPPPEHSSSWDNLFSKYYEEELKKRGG